MLSLRRSALPLILGVFAWLLATPAHAGPPFVTDDPEPVDFQHWEVYLATLQIHNDSGWNGTLPHVEVNYGVLPDVQLHAIAPAGYTKAPGESMQYGYSDTELGIKYRFIHETPDMPQVGIFPLVELPTGNSLYGLGNGKAQVYLPLWIQKTFGAWQTYGGGGYWINPGPGNHDWWFEGWQIQRKITEKLNIGAEIFHEGAQGGVGPTVGMIPPNGASCTAINFGAIYDINDNYHLMFTAGHTVQGPSAFIGYFAIQWTFGPEEKKPEPEKDSKSGK